MGGPATPGVYLLCTKVGNLKASFKLPAASGARKAQGSARMMTLSARVVFGFQNDTSSGKKLHRTGAHWRKAVIKPRVRPRGCRNQVEFTACPAGRTNRRLQRIVLRAPFRNRSQLNSVSTASRENEGLLRRKKNGLRCTGNRSASRNRGGGKAMHEKKDVAHWESCRPDKTRGRCWVRAYAGHAVSLCITPAPGRRPPRQDIKRCPIMLPARDRRFSVSYEFPTSEVDLRLP